MSELPTDLDLLLEAVSGVMGEEFTARLERTIALAKYEAARQAVLPVVSALEAQT